jgi:hypothetical protein
MMIALLLLAIQAAPSRQTSVVPVTVAIVDALDVPNATALILRRVTQTPSEVVLLASQSSPADFAAAMKALHKSIKAQRWVNTDVRIAVTVSKKPLDEGKGLARERQFLAGLKAKPVVEVPGLGKGRKAVVNLSVERT